MAQTDRFRDRLYDSMTRAQTKTNVATIKLFELKKENKFQ